MEIYFTSMPHPVDFIGRPLAGIFQEKENPGKEPLVHGGMFDKNIFQQFRARFNSVSITCGLPKSDYGQTVRLSLLGTLPDLTKLDWTDIPAHLISGELPLKPDEMTGLYGYRNTEDDPGGSVFVLEEFFFFEFQPGYTPATFSKFNASLGALRYCSEILHTLDQFKVVLMENGVYVHLRARISNSYKPPFSMNY